ncbi:secreted RxLR effector protein 161-like [Macadamia integrifolia]|uniref:secreted RxLR effector protein 161-like n=1 Tax=Macadamia integrifolia TaxID=60698 RepID=UPI001C4ED7A9|nr:secreted RxLR effector protein 161-like [Macadamia integrifolia]
MDLISQLRDGIFISQTKYLKEMLKKFTMEDCKLLSTPMMTGCKPDILQAVCMVAKFQADPKETHVGAIKRIFRYLKGTIGYGLWYSRSKSFDLKAYSDADWAGCVDERKSTSGGAFYLDNSLVAWHNKKQELVSLSTTETEYIAASTSCTQVLWMKQMLKDLNVEQN